MMKEGPLLRVRRLAGVLLKDWWRFRSALGAPGAAYLALCNRDEKLEAAPDGSGYRCLWRWTSDLHAPKYLPSLGRRLLQRALDDHPIRREPAPPANSATPQVSFVIGHRGVSRLPLLLATLESIAGQRDAEIECIVVEQDEQPRVASSLPAWVRHVHTPPPREDFPYCRSWAFNVGARVARGEVLVLHDNDLLVPADYSAQVLRRVREGYEVVNPKRYIFYIGEAHSEAVGARREGFDAHPPEAVMQNAEGGGSIAITREAYVRIGGMDEAFVGWGGEDSEFWERAMTLRHWPYSALPLVHLWHPAQAGKYRDDNATLALYRSLSQVPVQARIERLRAAASGDPARPVTAGEPRA